jgi:carbonic anhydrase
MVDSYKNKVALFNLLERNRVWAASIVAQDADYFKKLSLQQSPEYFWIGCSDSRVSANDLLDLSPGEIFVHRNVANVVVHTDLNCLSALQFAIDVLRVKHVIVCGHYGCSGVNTALTGRRIGLADNWLRHVQDVHQKHEKYLGEALSPTVRGDRLCELNVIEQVINVCQTTVVRDAWDRGQPLTVHGWAYGLKDGLLRDLDMTVSNIEELAPRLATGLAKYED